ncbi:rhodanese-like domain-containing protein [Sphingobium sp.]|uniref:rhodanese-like domain-containing protein n=1 Tax=Sphingobium sp. TaxID=1912891 RepID=UPI003B3A8881
MRLILIALLLAASPATAQDALFDGDGYRIAHYRAPVHQPPDGVGRIAPDAAAQLRPGRDALFIDVLPAEGGHRQSDGRWKLATPHDSIPDAHWFPEAGRGVPPPGIGEWFLDGIAGLTGGRRDRMLILFCKVDCWMGWNAAKRLRAHGYRNVWWLAEGVEGWTDRNRPLSPVRPEGGVAP